MINTKNKLRVWHIPQVPMKGFRIPVKDESQAALLIASLSLQHLWLEENNVIGDFSNAIGVEMFEDGEWTDYYNEEEFMEWDELEETYFSEYVNQIREANY